MNREIRECADQLIEAIRLSEENLHYHRTVEALEKYPGLFERIMELRRRTIELYHETEGSDLIESSEELGQEFAEIERLPEANAFLEAEEELVHVINQLTEEIASAVDLHTPGRTGQDV